MTSKDITAMAKDRQLWRKKIDDQDKPPKPQMDSILLLLLLFMVNENPRKIQK